MLLHLLRMTPVFSALVLYVQFDQHLYFNEHLSRGTPKAFSNFFLLLRLKRLGFQMTEVGILYQNFVLLKLIFWNFCMVWLFSVKFAQAWSVWKASSSYGRFFWIQGYWRLYEVTIDNWWSKSKTMGLILSEESSRRDQTMPKAPCQIVIVDVKEQRTTGTSKVFRTDFYNISICRYFVIELRFHIFLSNFFFSLGMSFPSVLAARMHRRYAAASALHTGRLLNQPYWLAYQRVMWNITVVSFYCLNILSF